MKTVTAVKQIIHILKPLYIIVDHHYFYSFWPIGYLKLFCIDFGELGDQNPNKEIIIQISDFKYQIPEI